MEDRDKMKNYCVDCGSELDQQGRNRCTGGHRAPIALRHDFCYLHGALYPKGQTQDEACPYCTRPE